MTLRRHAGTCARVLLLLCACGRPHEKPGDHACGTSGQECCDAGGTCRPSAEDGGAGTADAGVQDEWSEWLAPPDVPADPEYTVSADGTTVTDATTGLVWQKAVPDNPCPPDGTGVCLWQDAVTYCSGLSLGGFSSGWRLPTLIELVSIVNLGAFDPAIDSNVFPSTTSSGFWTATSYASESGGYWVVGFDSGSTSGISSQGSGAVRCVR